MLPVAPVTEVTVAALPPIFKPATGVAEVTTNGAVPVATFEINCVPVTVVVAVIEPTVVTPVAGPVPPAFGLNP